MGLEEQKEEREVLDSIFPDEIQDISDTEYRVTINLELPTSVEDEESPVILLKVTYPEDYPDVAPSLELSAPPNAPKSAHLNIQEDRDRLLEALQPSIEENMGMAMIFTLVSTLKDAAEVLMSERVQAVEAQRDFEAAKAEEEENRKFQGEAVTRESFLEWRANFKKEMEEIARKAQEEREAEDKKKKVSREEKRMTGRELWEKGLAGKIDEDYEDLAEDVSNLEIDQKA